MSAKSKFEYAEGIFHDGLGTYNEFAVANKIIMACNLRKPLFSLEASKIKMQNAINLLDMKDPRRQIFQEEIKNIETAAEQVVKKIQILITPAEIIDVKHVAKNYAGGNAADLEISIKLATEIKKLPISLKTDKSGKAALADIGQTSDLNKWFRYMFNMEKEELDAVISKMAPGSNLTELKRNYLNIAHLVQRVFIDKLGLVDAGLVDIRPGDNQQSLKTTSINNFSLAQPTNLAAVKHLVETVKRFSRGNDEAIVLVTNRTSGTVSTDATIDKVVLPTLSLKDISFRPSIPKAGYSYGSEIGIKYKGEVIFTVQIKHQRGASLTEANKMYFHDITTRLIVK